MRIGHHDFVEGVCNILHTYEKYAGIEAGCVKMNSFTFGFLKDDASRYLTVTEEALDSKSYIDGVPIVIDESVRDGFVIAVSRKDLERECLGKYS